MNLRGSFCFAENRIPVFYPYYPCHPRSIVFVCTRQTGTAVNAGKPGVIHSSALVRACYKLTLRMQETLHLS